MLRYFPEDIGTARQDDEDIAAAEKFNALQGFEKLKVWSKLAVYLAGTYSGILTACYFGNVFAEGLIILTSILVFKRVFKHYWHSASVLVCTITSLLTVYAGAKITVPFRYSQFLPVIIGLLIMYCMYRIAVITDKKPKKEKPKRLDYSKISKEERALYKAECNFTADELMFFKYRSERKLSHVTACFTMNISERTGTRLSVSITNKINEFKN